MPPSIVRTAKPRIVRNGMRYRARNAAPPSMRDTTGTTPQSIVRAVKPRIVRNGMRYRARNAVPLSTRDANGSTRQTSVHDARLLTHREKNPVVTVALHLQSIQELRYTAWNRDGICPNAARNAENFSNTSLSRQCGRPRLRAHPFSEHTIASAS